MNNMLYYNKAVVAVAMAVIFYLNKNYGIELPVTEDQAQILVGLLTAFLVWAVPNKDKS